MKLTLKINKTHGKVPAMWRETDEEKENRSYKSCCIAAVVVLSFMICLSGVIVTAVYMDVKLSKENFKEYNAVVHTLDGKAVSETIILTDTEELISVDNFTTVYDFNSGLIVHKWENTSGVDKYCFVANFNTSELDPPVKLKNEFNSSNINLYPTKYVHKLYESTDIRLNEAALGPRSRQICTGSDIYFLREIDEKESSIRRNKRQTKMSIAREITRNENNGTMTVTTIITITTIIAGLS